MQANVAIPGQSQFFLQLPDVDPFLLVSLYLSPPLHNNRYLKSLDNSYMLFSSYFNIYLTILLCPCSSTV